MKILYLEPFYGGSHEAVAKGFAANSRHGVEILGLPGRFWKWRMRGAALWFARQIGDIGAWDLIFATDMLDLTDFKALAGPGCPPVAFYFHENQLSYPLAPGEKRDFHLGFTNIISACAADLVLFNSAFHRDEFFWAARKLIRKMPDARPTWMLDEIRVKTRVLYPGFYMPENPKNNLPESVSDPSGPAAYTDGQGRAAGKAGAPLVVWNHRWEHDKDPETFFRVMGRLKAQNIPFRLAVLGEQYEKAPSVFERAQRQFRDEIAVWGFQPSAEAYRSWLSRGACVVSTANQENFGISVMEAMAHGCFPLLPDRLSYPELIPPSFHEAVIYTDEAGLEKKLAALLSDPGPYSAMGRSLSEHGKQFAWQRLSRQWDARLESLVKRAGASGVGPGG